MLHLHPRVAALVSALPLLLMADAVVAIPASARAGSVAGAGAAAVAAQSEGDLAAGDPAGVTGEWELPGTIAEWLVAPVRSRNEAGLPLPSDPIFERYHVLQDAAPRAGDEVEVGPGQTVAWRAIGLASEDGSVEDEALAGGWAVGTFTSDRAGAAMVRLHGGLSLHVNGVSHAGDVYRRGRVYVPIPVVAGANHVWVHVARGGFRLTLEPSDGVPFATPIDATMPDIWLGAPGRQPMLGSVMVVNPSAEGLVPHRLNQQIEAGMTRLIMGPSDILAASCLELPYLPPFSTTKVQVHVYLSRVPGRSDFSAGEDDPRLPLQVRLKRFTAEELVGPPGPMAYNWSDADCTVTVRVRQSEQSFRVTYQSAIDRSIQYYGVRPPRGFRGALRDHEAGASGDALVLTCHGAGVEAAPQRGPGGGQIDAYASHARTWIVAATNRRPFGFDWEAWGRKETIATLDHALDWLPVDARRVYLTGHSMGGHGAWHLGVTHADRFAAIAPSAGWGSLFGYGSRTRYGGEPGTPGELLGRGQLMSETSRWVRNLAGTPVYVLHGEADGTVPFSQAEAMVELLAPFHRSYHLERVPGAGHWWDRSPSPGADCVDWPPMFDLFARTQRDPAPSRVDFRTADLGVSHRHHWLRVLGQARPFAPSHVEARVDARGAPIRVYLDAAENVTRLALDLAAHDPAPGTSMIELVVADGEGGGVAQASFPFRGTLFLERDAAGAWGMPVPLAADVPRYADTPWPAAQRHPGRYGQFRSGFDNGFVFVYATQGSAPMNAAALEKARYDASVFWYRGDGAVEVMPDTYYDAERYAGRTVVLYGNTNSNAAWQPAPDGELGVYSMSVEIGGRTIRAADASVMAWRPLPGSANARRVLIGATGPIGMRRVLRVHGFRSGVEYPDLTVFGLTPAEAAASMGQTQPLVVGYWGEGLGFEGAEMWVHADATVDE